MAVHTRKVVFAKEGGTNARGNMLLGYVFGHAAGKRLAEENRERSSECDDTYVQKNNKDVAEGDDELEGARQSVF